MNSGTTLALAIGAILAAGILVAILAGSESATSSGEPITSPPLAGGPSAAGTPGVPSPADQIATGGPVPVRAAPGCRPEAQYLLNEDGTTTPVYTCPGHDAAPVHAYESYSTEALAALAYADAKAAEILGMRLRDSDAARALSLTLRASALAGGDPAPILAFSNAYPQPTAIDGVPVRKTVRTKFVLSAVADLLGAGRNNLPHWEAEIRKASTDAGREIELLREQARRLVEEMQQIELEVTGSSTFGGQSDA